MGSHMWLALVIFATICLCLGTSKHYDYVLNTRNTSSSNSRIHVEPGSSLTLVCRSAEKFNSVEWLINRTVQAYIYTERCDFKTHNPHNITKYTCSSDEYNITIAHLQESGEWMCRFSYISTRLTDTVYMDVPVTESTSVRSSTGVVTSMPATATDDTVTSSARTLVSRPPAVTAGEESAKSEEDQNDTMPCKQKAVQKSPVIFYVIVGCLTASLFLNVGLGVCLLVSKCSKRVKQNVTNDPVVAQETIYLEPRPDWPSVSNQNPVYTLPTVKDERHAYYQNYRSLGGSMHEYMICQ